MVSVIKQPYIPPIEDPSAGLLTVTCAIPVGPPSSGYFNQLYAAQTHIVQTGSPFQGYTLNSRPFDINFGSRTYVYTSPTGVITQVGSGPLVQYVSLLCNITFRHRFEVENYGVVPIVAGRTAFNSIKIVESPSNPGFYSIDPALQRTILTRNYSPGAVSLAPFDGLGNYSGPSGETTDITQTVHATHLFILSPEELLNIFGNFVPGIMAINLIASFILGVAPITPQGVNAGIYTGWSGDVTAYVY